MSLRSWMGKIFGVGGATSEKVEREISFQEKVWTFGLYRCGACSIRQAKNFTAGGKTYTIPKRNREGCGQEREIDGKWYCGYPGSHCQQKYKVRECEGSITIWDENPFEEGWEGVYEWSEVEIRKGEREIREDINGSIQ